MQPTISVALSLSLVSNMQAQTTATINASDPMITINRNIYGHFAEHLGRCIYDGFYVGEENKTIPNVNGVRTDIIDALKKLNIPNLR